MFGNDWVEAIIALPTDLFYNTGIQTYIWILTNRKPKQRYGKVQLIDASSERFWKSIRKNLGKKRREIPEQERDEIVNIYGQMLNGGRGSAAYSRVFEAQEFGYREIRVERPLKLNFKCDEERLELLKQEKAFLKLDSNERGTLLEALVKRLPNKLFKNRNTFEEELEKVFENIGFTVKAPLRKAVISVLSKQDETAEICRDAKGKPEADTNLRDHELIPLKEDWQEYFDREVKPFVADAWVDEKYVDEKDGKIGRVGYEINFNRYFYKYVPPRPVTEIENDLQKVEKEIKDMLTEVI